MKTIKLLLTGLLVTGLSISMVGCSDDDDTITGSIPEAGEASVRVGHLSPDAPNVDVWVDGAQVLTDVPFGAFSEYLQVPEGDHRVQVTQTGTTEPFVIDATVTVEDETTYTIAATGELADIAPSVFVDDTSVDATMARLRFVHAGPDAPPVDITLTDGTILFDDVRFGEDSDYLSVGAGAYDLQVRVAGTPTVALSFGDVPVSAGMTYTVFAKGLLGDGTLTAVVTVDAPGAGDTKVDLTPAMSEVRVAHLSPDAPNVDVYVDGVETLTNIPFETVSAYLSVTASTHQIEVFATGSITNPVIDTPLTLLPGETYTVAASGLLAENDISPVVLVDQNNGAADPWVRFSHLSPDAPNVDVAVMGGPTLFSNVAFRGAAGYDPVGAGTYTLEVQLSSNGAVALTVPGVVLDPQKSYTVFAIGLAGDGSLDAKLVEDAP